jgi:hypothetical protein
MLMPMPNMHAAVGTATPPRYAGRHREPRGLSLRQETLVFSTLLAFVSDTVSQSVEVVVDVLDHFFSSLHG